eukprot:1909189-Pyramimonas_sp.AAC.1
MFACCVSCTAFAFLRLLGVGPPVPGTVFLDMRTHLVVLIPRFLLPPPRSSSSSRPLLLLRGVLPPPSLPP